MRYKIRLQVIRNAAGGLESLKVLSIEDPEGKAVETDVVGDDPLTRPPLSPDLQAKGREILAKMKEANRYWLDQPPSEVHSYRYDFQLGDKEPKTYEVSEDRGVPGSIRQGISYISILHELTTHPKYVIFRQIDVQPDQIALGVHSHQGCIRVCGERSAPHLVRLLQHYRIRRDSDRRFEDIHDTGVHSDEYQEPWPTT